MFHAPKRELGSASGVTMAFTLFTVFCTTSNGVNANIEISQNGSGIRPSRLMTRNATASTPAPPGKPTSWRAA